MLLDVVRVKAYTGYVLKIEFDNGEIRGFDMMPYMDRKPWVKLKKNNEFYSARVENGTVVWGGNIDIDPEALYELSVPCTIKQATDFAGLPPRSIDNLSEPARHSLTTSRTPAFS